MNVIKVVAASVEDGKIYAGEVDVDTSKWLEGREDKTDQAIESVLSHMLATGRDYLFPLNESEQYAVLKVTLHDEIPPHFMSAEVHPLSLPEPGKM